jgi:hypothetical protein
MTEEPTPRQKRTEELLEQARGKQGEVTKELAFLRELLTRSQGHFIDMDMVIDSLMLITAKNAHATTKLLQAVENMAEAPCFDQVKVEK